MNELRHLAEFKELLTDYEVSAEGKVALEGVQLVLCSGAAASGRNEVIRHLLKTGDYYFIVSDTTRKPRVNNDVLEQNGVQYWFRSEEQMLGAIQAGLMVEAEVIHNQQVSGMSIREINKAKEQGKFAITDIDKGGVGPVVKAKPDSMCLFFLPPDFEQWQERFRKRGEMEPGEYRRRMETAVEEFENAITKPYYWFVVNDKIEDTVSYVQQIVHDQRVDEAKQTAGRQLTQLLLEQTQEFLAS